MQKPSHKTLFWRPQGVEEEFQFASSSWAGVLGKCREGLRPSYYSQWRKLIPILENMTCASVRSTQQTLRTLEAPMCTRIVSNMSNPIHVIVVAFMGSTCVYPAVGCALYGVFYHMLSACSCVPSTGGRRPVWSHLQQPYQCVYLPTSAPTSHQEQLRSVRHAIDTRVVFCTSTNNVHTMCEICGCNSCMKMKMLFSASSS